MSNIDREYTQATLCFPIRGDEVLLAEKQQKIGAGYLNGFGGRAEIFDKDIYATNSREVEEEVVINVTCVRKMGEIAFHNPSQQDELKNMLVHIFIATKWDGEPTETNEMKKIAWYKINNLDYDKFLSADKLFIPQILAGKCLKGLVEYNEDWSVKTASINEVEKI